MFAVFVVFTCCLLFIPDLSDANYVGLELSPAPMNPISKADVFMPRFGFKGDKKGEKKGNDVYYGGGSYGNNGGYGGNSAGYGGNSGYGSGGSYGNSGYNYDMEDCKKKKEEEWLWGLLPIPIAVAVGLGILALIPNLILLAQFLIYFIGRSNNDPLLKDIINGLPKLNLLQNVDEAMETFADLKTDEQCRSRLACELGFVFKDSPIKARLLKSIDVLPTFVGKYLTPLKRAAEDGKNCERYNCSENVLSTFNKFTSGNLKSS